MGGFNKGKGGGYGKGGSYGGYGKGGNMNVINALVQAFSGNSWGQQPTWKKTFKSDKSGGELGEFVGTIKSFSNRNFWGFIECPDLQAQYGDVFLHGDEKKGYRQGMTVKFTAVLGKDGKAAAMNLKSGLK
eukprot:TRINITY_DN31511_c0_g1_i1.p1 TRINITY_DN31511_c0_g1~~TRINITY_DN31511_c0_g1_i1.p1  ORF type:complete len:154 (+),score=31.54 TRINITY_DN31511_c0_g1_i1:72-464(+)